MEARDKLLSFLDVDRAKAAERYEQIRSRLVRLFEWRGAMSPEDLADQTMDRVASRLQDGAEPSAKDRIEGYFHSAAKIIYQEHRSREMRQHAIASAVGSSLSKGEMQEGPMGDSRLEALRSVLNELPKEQRELLLAYFPEDDHIRRRQELARSLGIPMNALRLRAYRLRRKLEQRIGEILKADIPDLPEPQGGGQPQVAELAMNTYSGEPDILVIWDPEILSPEEYSELVGALGDLVRASGGLGLSRAQPEGYRVPAFAVVPV